jgi:uncharacterized protein
MTAWQMAVVAVAFTTAGVAKGVLGIGLPVIAIGVLTVALPLESAIAIMTIPTIVTNIWQAIYGEGLVRLLRRFWPMALAVSVSILATAYLGHLGAPATEAWLGILLVIYSALALLAWRPVVSRRAERWASPLVGLVTGAVVGTTGIAAVPFLPYMQSLDLSKDDLVQALGILFIFMSVALALALFRQGSYDQTNAIGGLVAIVPAAIGVWIGQKTRDRLSSEMFRRVFLIGLLGLGFNMAHPLL